MINENLNKEQELQKYLSKTDKELLSNWMVFSKLIELLEKVTWLEAQNKSKALSKVNQRQDYINKARNGEILQIGDVKEQSSKEDKQSKPKENLKPSPKSRIKDLPKKLQDQRRNYKRLLKIVPDLLEKIKSEEEIVGKSHSAGYMPLNFELYRKPVDGKYIFSMAHYYKQNGDLVSDPDMLILVDFVNEFVEALSFQNSMYYAEVYDDIFIRNKVDRKQEASQNDFLTTWLKNLINQNHRIQWKQEVQGTNKEDEMKEEKKKEEERQKEAQMRIKDLAIIIKRLEELSLEQAEKKAKKLISEGKQIEFFKELAERLLKCERKELYQAIYYQLLALNNQFGQRFSDEDVYGVLQVKDKPKTMRYEFTMAADTDDKPMIQVKEAKKNGSGGFLIIRINKGKRIAFLELRADGFNSKSNFNSENASLSQLKKANREVLKWLESLKTKEYEMLWDDEPEVQQELPKVQEVEKEDPDKIYPQEPGQLVLLAGHKKAGVRQKHIDWVNKHKEGLTFYPAKNPKNNTKSIEQDLRRKAKKPGFRISRTGMIYHEGRSNRSDMTSQGL